MRFTRQAAVKAPVKPAETHVVHWVPAYLNDDGQGVWVLQSAAEYEASKNGYGCPESYEPRDAGPEVLADWTEGQLGYPVTLVLAWANFSSFSFRPLSLHVSREPVYYASLAGE